MINAKLDLIRSFMQLEGNAKIISTCSNLDGSVDFTGYQEVNGGTKCIKIVMGKDQKELINEFTSVIEIYNCYKEMGYF